MKESGCHASFDWRLLGQQAEMSVIENIVKEATGKEVKVEKKRYQYCFELPDRFEVKKAAMALFDAFDIPWVTYTNKEKEYDPIDRCMGYVPHTIKNVRSYARWASSHR